MTPDQRQQVLSLLEAGVRPSAVARSTGVPVNTVYRVNWLRRNPNYEKERQERRRKAPPRVNAGFVDRRVTIGFDDPTLEQIDARAKADGVSRAEMIRQLVEWGLEAE